MTDARGVRFKVERWEGQSDDVRSATLGALRIDGIGAKGPVPLVEVFDLSVQSVRPFIVVPVYPLVRWLILNWWRLCWEPHRRSVGWRLSHCMAAIGEGIAWPPLELSSDGEFVQIRSDGEEKADVASIRYLQSAAIDVPLQSFMQAIDDLVTQVRGRLASQSLVAPDLDELWAELADERSDPVLAEECRLQAAAGVHPGDASEEWIARARALGATTGPRAIDEVMAAMPSLGSLDEAQRQVDTIRGSDLFVDLNWVATPPPAEYGEIPWQRGKRLAELVRNELGKTATDPIPTAELEDLFHLELPTVASPKSALTGAFRSNGRAAVRVPTHRIDNQRFYLARLLGCSIGSPPEERLLPVTRETTALQKAGRSFARELLCPWPGLDAFTEAHGLDEDGIAEAAAYFGVSSMVVVSALVDHGKLPRDRLEAFF